jgi:predicted phosphodiesterase
MLGDAGEDTAFSSQVLNGLKSRLESDQTQSGVIFLGDNLYPMGLHKKSNSKRAEDELRLNAQLDVVKNYAGKVIFVPGNHDWKSGHKNGLDYVLRQEKYIKKYLNKKNVFYPGKGCPGPKEVQLAPGLLLLIIDTQWWLHQYKKAIGERDGCEVNNHEEFSELFKDMLKKYRDQNVIVAGHHPLYSNGNHGGNFKFKDHLFPLTAKYKKAYVPLPFLGSVYPLYRKFIGLKQDLSHPIYQDMRRALEKEMNEYDNVIYVAGHEHNLQYTHKKNIHHVISGSASKVTTLNNNQSLNFGTAQRGYSKISYYENGEVWLEFIVNKDNIETGVFKKLLFTKRVIGLNKPVFVIKKSYAGLYKYLAPDSAKSASGVKTVILGNLNRELWATKVKVPYLDIHSEKGGLTPIKKGGGMQTLSLRMQGGDGNQYTLRGIKKSSTYTVSKNLRGTFAQDIIYDGFAGSHPYAAIAVASLSKEVGVYYSDAKLVYVPKDSILGDYLEQFGGMFCLMEQRPNGNMSAEDQFGNSKKVDNFFETLEEIHGKYSHKIDKDYTVRARLFDMLIGDFDRHDDQWRWAQFKENGQNLYRPIPRDRDQAFFVSDGIAMSLMKQRWLLWYTQDFYDGAKDVIGLNSQARHFDRSFLTEASEEDWIKQAEYIQNNISEEEIEQAVKEFPKNAFDARGEEIIRGLKIRKAELVKYAKEYYHVLSREVDVVGTYNDDFFEVKRHDNGQVEVTVYDREKDKKVKSRKHYHRIFDPKDTREIRLYGLGGEDEYKVKGKVKKSILVRIIAGENKDDIEDKSRVRGLRKMTRIYDVKGKNNIKKGKETKVKVMEEDEFYDYDRMEFKYNKTMPLLSLGYNVNDGFYVGPGFKHTKHGFKKSPYHSTHKLVANRTFVSDGFNVYYDYNFVDLIGKGDFGGKVIVNTPLIYRYYGEENTDLDLSNVDVTDFNISMDNYEFRPTLTYSSSNDAHKLILGLNYQHVDFNRSPITEFDSWELKSQDYIGLSTHYNLSNLDNKVNPHSGIDFRIGGDYLRNIDKEDVDFLKFSTQLSVFIPINFIKKQTTLSIRTGAAHNVGKHTFYQSNFLSGWKNFRGVDRNRYSGKSIFYNNFDLRVSLFDVSNYVLPFDVGVLGHYDLAIVDSDYETPWLSSYGGGAFINILDAFILVGTYSFSKNNRLLSIGGKFLF